MEVTGRDMHLPSIYKVKLSQNYKKILREVISYQR